MREAPAGRQWIAARQPSVQDGVDELAAKLRLQADFAVVAHRKDEVAQLWSDPREGSLRAALRGRRQLKGRPLPSQGAASSPLGMLQPPGFTVASRPAQSPGSGGRR